jgi:hypothetical protein
MRRTIVAVIIFVWVLLAPNRAFSEDEKTNKKNEDAEQQKTKDSSTVTGGKEKPEDNKKNTSDTKPSATTVTTGANLPAVTLGKTEIYEPSLKALTMLFVIAVLLESAFALVFSWRVFLTYFSVSGVKTIVMLFISWIVVYAFDFDILASLINVYREKPAESLMVSKLITAMILAGGSAAVNKIFVALGFRSIPVPPLEVKPPETKAWVAVIVRQQVSVGRVTVSLKDLGVAGPTDPAPIAGTACFGAPNLFDLLFRNPRRFPANGGYEVIPGRVYQLSVSGQDAAGNLKSVTVGNFVFANRAIVDFDVTF